MCSSSHVFYSKYIIIVFFPKSDHLLNSTLVLTFALSFCVYSKNFQRHFEVEFVYSTELRLHLQNIFAKVHLTTNEYDNMIQIYFRNNQRQ